MPHEHDEQEKLREKITAVQAKYAIELMEKANVIGIAMGLAKDDGEYTQELCLVVMVSEKVPVEELDEKDIIPNELDGVRVDVQEMGIFTAQ
jgi:hypothetical protein